MEIETQYAVKRFIPNTSFPQIYFEAIANAFDADATEISVHTEVQGGIRPDRLDVTIRDNGVAFTNERFHRFRRLQEPHDEFHKGLGRLVFLQYFKEVKVVSITDARERRNFVFSNTWDGRCSVETADSHERRGTTLTFRGFDRARLRSYDQVRPAVLKRSIIEHFLPLLHHRRVAHKPFTITISMETDSAREQSDFYSDTVTLTEADVPQLQQRMIERAELGMFDRIVMWYAVRSNGVAGSVSTAISIDGRTVPLQLVKPSSIPAGDSAVFLFESPAFTGKSDNTRQVLELPDSVPRKQLEDILREEINLVLNHELPVIRQRNEQVREQLETRFPHLVGLFRDEVGLIDRDDAIRDAQWRFFDKQRDVLDGGGVHDEESYRKSLELSSRTLTEYVLYREYILGRLKELSVNNREEEVHNLIVPRFRVFNGDGVGEDVYSNNAWILDDKFMAFRTILSEKRMSEIISVITSGEESVDDNRRPDISMIFSADPADDTAVDVVVVEVKKREPDEKEGTYASIQLASRAQKLVDHCPNIRHMWYFGIIEMDNNIARLLRTDQWTPLYSKGHVFYRERQVEREDGVKVLAPTYLVSFDAIIADAAARNHTFLELLKGDIRRHGASADAAQRDARSSTKSAIYK